MEPTYEELARTASRRLNVGCGDYAMRFWMNLDNDPACRGVQIRQEALAYLSECEPGQYDEIYAGHFLEHLAFPEAGRFIAECYRVLAPGGKLGLLVPDTRQIMFRWLHGMPDEVEWPAGVWRPVSDLDEVCHLFLFSDVQTSPHRWAWCEETLARAMAIAGFDNLEPIDRFHDPRIPVGEWYQCGLDGWKRSPKTMDAWVIGKEYEGLKVKLEGFTAADFNQRFDDVPVRAEVKQCES